MAPYVMTQRLFFPEDCFWGAMRGLLRKMIFCLLPLLTLLCLSGCIEMEIVPSSLRDQSWLAEDIMGGGVMDRSHLTIAFDSEGRISGDTGCNRMMGLARFSRPDKIAIPTHLAVTRRACGSPAMADLQRKYLATLPQAVKWEIKNDLLYFYDKNGTAILRFSREQ